MQMQVDRRRRLIRVEADQCHRIQATHKLYIDRVCRRVISGWGSSGFEEDRPVTPATRDFTIAGVMPPGFVGETVGQRADFWAPLMMEEHFLPGGPFAILPLTGNRSSIVWTERTSDAERLGALPDYDFREELEKRFGLHLGEIELIGPRRAFPLGLYTARTFIAERLALIGDAAHIIHPIAGHDAPPGTANPLTP